MKVSSAMLRAMRLCGPQAEVAVRLVVICRNTMGRGIADEEIGHAILRALSVAGGAALAAVLVEQDSDSDAIWTESCGFPV
jgi:alkylhydroperoxidase/carboxymuconolactone decarboxylase family protein YurZ